MTTERESCPKVYRTRRITRTDATINTEGRSACEAGIKKEEPKGAPIILMEDNLTKAKRAIMITKELCPTGAVVQAMMNQPNQNMQDAERIAKMKKTIIRKTREYVNTFPKYNGESRKGQEWCAKICFLAQQYNVETIAANEVKFTI